MPTDKKDVQIVTALDTNSRIPVNQLAKDVLLSKENVRARLRRLRQKKFFKEFMILFNGSKLGYTYYLIHYKYGSIQLKQEEQIVQFIISKTSTLAFAKVEGEFDIFMIAAYPSKSQALEELGEFLSLFGKHIIDRRVDSMTYITRSPSTFLGFTSKQQAIHLPLQSHKSEDIDELDKHILRELSNNARVPILRIAKQQNTTSSKITYRIKKLEEKKIIAGYVSTYNLQSANYLSIHLEILLKDPNWKTIIQEHLIQSSHVQYIYNTIGTYDFTVLAYFPSQKEFHAFLSEFKDKYQKHFLKYTIHHIIKDHATNWIPF
jgi:DNA-binding Lrp family transcriptional regulator